MMISQFLYWQTKLYTLMTPGLLEGKVMAQPLAGQTHT
jgi:hypothetical protein